MMKWNITHLAHNRRNLCYDSETKFQIQYCYFGWKFNENRQAFE
jgi:hypothetical protein